MADNEELLPSQQPTEAPPDKLAGSSADYANYQPPQKQRSPIWRKLAIVGAAIVVLFAIVGAVYWFVLREKTPIQTADTAQNSQSGSQLAQADSQITTKTKHYVSQNFRLEFDYPEDWFAGQDNAEQITLLSPDLKLKDTDNKDVVGQISLSIQSNGLKIPGVEGDGAVASRASTKINYVKPTSAQRDSTYISFLRFSESQSAQALDGVFITGDLGYQKDQNVLSADIEKVNPIIYLNFYLCPNTGCIEVSGVYGIGLATWDNPNISGPLTKMLESLVIN